LKKYGAGNLLRERKKEKVQRVEIKEEEAGERAVTILEGPKEIAKVAVEGVVIVAVAVVMAVSLAVVMVVEVVRMVVEMVEAITVEKINNSNSSCSGSSMSYDGLEKPQISDGDGGGGGGGGVASGGGGDGSEGGKGSWGWGGGSGNSSSSSSSSSGGRSGGRAPFRVGAWVTDGDEPQVQGLSLEEIVNSIKMLLPEPCCFFRSTASAT
jgi:hypothetical protein